MSIATAGRRRSRWGWMLPVAWIVVTILVAAAPFLGLSSQLMRHVFLALTIVLMVSGLNLTFGWSGELNLGIPAMYAAGAYAAGYMSMHWVNDLLLGILFGALAALVIGLITGIPGLRLGGWMLAIVSFFVVLLIPNIIQIVPADILGGSTGLIGIPKPKLFGITLSTDAYFAVAVVITALWLAIYRNTVISRIGESLVTLQQGQALAPSLGMSRYRLKLFAYAMGAVPAGIAGALYANLDRFLGLESFTINLAVLVLAASIIAGGRSIYAVLFGAALVQFINFESTQYGEFGELVFGILLVLGGVALGGGISGLIKSLASARARRRAPVDSADSAASEASAARFDAAIEPLAGEPLVVEGVSKRFGGMQALEDVTFRAEPGRITALIGPNGSGKTTTLNIVCGFYPVTTGVVRLGDKTVSSKPPAWVARAGVARTFQTPLIADGLSTVETVASGSIASHHVSLIETVLRLPRYRRVRSQELVKAYGILQRLGIERFADEPADSLPLGTRRMTELARAVAASPKVILLDEVASGLDTHEVAGLARMLKAVAAAGATVVLVEHNFALVRSLADHIVVLADGQVLTQGSPAEVERHPEVLGRFLGEMSDLSGTSITTREDGASSPA